MIQQVFQERSYQTKLFGDIRQAAREGHRKILVVMPTGAGKGYCTAKMMQASSEKDQASLFFAAQRELIFQVSKQLDRVGISSRTIMSGVEDEYDSYEAMAQGNLNTLIARDTLWSRAFKNKKIGLPSAKVIHVDECHGILAPTYLSILSAYEDAFIVGWTATPCRTDNRPLGGFFTAMVLGPTYAELQRLGFLTPVRVIAPSRPDLRGLRTGADGDYAKGALQERMNKDEMVGCIVSEWKRNANDRGTICFAAGIEHSVHIRDLFRSHGITAEHVDGNTTPEEREDILGRANDGLLQVVTNYGVLHTGVDVPRWKYMINARPTKSFGLWRQMGGRIQRPFEDHDHCMIQDHSDCAIVFGHPDEDVEWELSGDTDIAKKHIEARKRLSGDPKDPNEIKPARCRECKTEYRGPICPKCGWKPEPQGLLIEMEEGELTELERKKVNRKATIDDKQATWDKCLGWAVGNGKKVGAAAHRYKQTYGCFPPNQLNNVPRSQQWQLSAKEFYREHVAPKKQSQQLELTL